MPGVLSVTIITNNCEYFNYSLSYFYSLTLIKLLYSEYNHQSSMLCKPNIFFNPYSIMIRQTLCLLLMYIIQSLTSLLVIAFNTLDTFLVIGKGKGRLITVFN